MIRRNQRVPTPTTIQWPRANEFLTYCLTLALRLIFIYLISRKTDIFFCEKEFSVCKSNREGLSEFSKNLRYVMSFFYICLLRTSISIYPIPDADRHIVNFFYQHNELILEKYSNFKCVFRYPSTRNNFKNVDFSH